MMDFSAFATLAQTRLGQFTSGEMEKFGALDALYRDWNSKINVISRKDIDSLYLHHVLHSLSIAAYLRQTRPELYELLRGRTADGPAPTFLDLGTGGGFPGIPLAILFPGASFTLCDSVGKKILVASEIARALGLSNVRTVNARAESLDGSFDFIVSRAVASLEDFYPWVRGRFKRSVLYLRGGDVAQECALLMQRFRVPGGKISTCKVDSLIPDVWFEGKFVVEIRRFL